MLVLVAVHAGVAATLPWWGRRIGRGAWAVAALAPLAVLAWSAVQAPGILGGTPVEESLSWAPSLELTFDVRLDPLSLLAVWVVSGVGVLVLAYSASYFERREAGRESALLLAFSGAMLGLVVADNLFALYLFWELTTVVSFLLIAGRGDRAARRRAAEQGLLVTAAGGLTMLAGFVLLGQAAGSYRISRLVADPPRGDMVTVALVLVLIGAFAKSAQMPFHGWLPAAMEAPTPVSAYLHAAAMVKAGVYLVARLAPGFAETGPWRPMVLAVGLTSMVLAAWRALRETDLKRLLAYGTISELGMLMALLGTGTRTAALAGAAMLVAHAAFKAPLFLVTGILDKRTGTRDVRLLSGLGRRMPVLFAVGAAAAASMAGVPLLLGFLAKEAAYEAFLHSGKLDGRELYGHDWLFAALFLGSVLTVAYTGRFLWGAFAVKPGVETGDPAPPGPGFLAPAAALSVTGLVLGLWYHALSVPVAAYADTYATGGGGAGASGGKPYELALWHGLTPVLGLSLLALLLGIALHLGSVRWVFPGPRHPASHPAALPKSPVWRRLPRLPDAQHGYEAALRAMRTLTLRTVRHTQVGSLPAYLAVLLITVLALPGSALLGTGDVSFGRPEMWTSSVQLPLAAVVLTTAVAVTATRHRLTGVMLTGAVGYGVAGLFLVRGAPDLALTQFLVESLTLVAIVLVLRRMPTRFTPERTAVRTRVLQIVVSAGMGVFVALFALVATTARDAPAVSGEQLRRTEETGAHNAVNAIIVDFRAMDTLGEIAVLLVAALGVFSLIGIWQESEGEAAARPEREAAAADPAGNGRGTAPSLRRSPAASWDEPHERWLPGAAERPGGERSVLLEVLTRLLFPSLLVLSLYLLVSGHEHPGGGFSAGLVAGQAYVLRYLVGGRADLGIAAPTDPGTLAGGGLALAAVVGLLPVAFGAEALSSTVVETWLPVVGTLKFATSMFFDVGVYLLVVGVTLKLLSALGVGLSPQTSDEPETLNEPESSDGLESSDGGTVEGRS
ncbi:Na+/H+ antiporter subunit A [Streptomyces sp. N2-109]|uniref:Na+/H+ antiporter subunit A n=1 Tax=Streptomyces gossypii TaxID=2883101 RepID=A0ABT2JSX9_9ACTN|nr:Na+/H+ antiporter subunit A [Streptomyces gossypii]MCT2590977.1 Na+/H+ antiporter subunit A [Streptomyces gossypii]